MLGFKLISKNYVKWPAYCLINLCGPLENPYPRPTNVVPQKNNSVFRKLVTCDGASLKVTELSNTSNTVSEFLLRLHGCSCNLYVLKIVTTACWNTSKWVDHNSKRDT